MSARTCIVVAAVALAACSAGSSSGACSMLVTKILACDPSAAGVSRASLEASCPTAPLHCATISTSTPGGCNAFMSCLYGD